MIRACSVGCAFVLAAVLPSAVSKQPDRSGSGPCDLLTGVGCSNKNGFRPPRGEVSFTQLQQSVGRKVRIAGAIVQKKVSESMTLKSPGKTQVVIFYVNESRATANVTRLSGWAKESNDERIQKIGKRLDADAQEFTETVAVEAAALREAAGKAEQPFAVAVFNNALAVEGKFHYLPAGMGKDFEVGDLNLPRVTSPILMENPLASPHGLAASLLAVALKFPPEKHSYLLIAKSHGSEEHLISPLVVKYAGPGDKDSVIGGLKNALDIQERRVKDQPALIKESGLPILIKEGSVPILDATGPFKPQTAHKDFLKVQPPMDGRLDSADLLVLDYAGPQVVREAMLASYLNPTPGVDLCKSHLIYRQIFDTLAARQ